MRTIYYAILTLMGIILSVPLTIVVIALQQANFNARKINKHLEEASK